MPLMEDEKGCRERTKFFFPTPGQERGEWMDEIPVDP